MFILTLTHIWTTVCPCFRDIALKLLREKFPEQAESLDENMKNLTEAYKVIFGQLITKYHLLYIMLLKDKSEKGP